MERITTLATRYRPRLYGKEPRWNDLRRIGNSPIAKASIVVPVLGYLILFHSDLIDYLRLHSSFCQNCSISWRLHLIYFACCCFAVGSVIYALRCPEVIKIHGIAREFFEAEKRYFSASANLQYLFYLFEIENESPTIPLALKECAAKHRDLGEHELTQLANLMGQYYFVQNRKAFKSRVAVLTAYSLGFVFLAIPTVLTFLQVLFRIFENLSFH